MMKKDRIKKEKLCSILKNKVTGSCTTATNTIFQHWKDVSLNLFIVLIISIYMTFIITLIISGPRKTFFYLWGIYDGYNLILEYKLSNSLDKLNQTKTNESVINLQQFVKKQIKRICFQHPYMLQEAFEKQIGHKAEGFSGISDGHGYVVWLFYSDGSTDRARPSLIRFLNGSKPICRQSTFISLQTNEQGSEFFKFHSVEDD